MRTLRISFHNEKFSEKYLDISEKVSIFVYMKKHSQVPNDMAKDGISPREQLVYAVLHSYDNPEHKVFPSLDKLAERSQLSVPTVRASLKILEDAGYIKIEKKGRKNYYTFSKYLNFEPFSDEFLDNKDITPTTKAYLVAAQQFMYKDVEGLGKLSYSNRVMSEHINMPESSIRKCNKELEKKNYLTVIKNASLGDTKIFNLNDLGQAIIWALQNHEERITQNTEKVADLEKRMEVLEKQLKSKDELLAKLLKNKQQQDELIL